MCHPRAANYQDTQRRGPKACRRPTLFHCEALQDRRIMHSHLLYTQDTPQGLESPSCRQMRLLLSLRSTGSICNGSSSYLQIAQRSAFLRSIDPFRPIQLFHQWFGCTLRQACMVNDGKDALLYLTRAGSIWRAEERR